MKTKDLSLCAIIAAFLCIVAPLSVPIGPIPITLALFFVYLAGALLGWKRGLIAVAVYVLLGAVGLPVFSGYQGGIQKLLGVTGGYIVGYLPCVAIVGLAADKCAEKKWALPVAMVVGTIVLYFIGTVWFMITTKNTLAASLGMCVIPFLPGDAVKIVVATILAMMIRPRISRFLND